MSHLLSTCLVALCAATTGADGGPDAAAVDGGVPTEAEGPAGGGPPEAADAGTRDLGSELDELARRLGILGEELETDRTGSAPVAPSLDAAREVGVGPAGAKVYAREGLSIGGYGELLFSFYDQRLQNGQYQQRDNLGDTQRVILYVGYKFNSWLVFNSEIEFEHSGFSDEHAEGEVIIEFATLDFLLRPWLKLRAGQLLLPVGFINELHEPPVFLGVKRPVLESGAGLIPSTWHELGAGLYGSLPGSLTYRLDVINGLDAARFNADGDGTIGSGKQDGHQVIANRPAFTGRLDWTPTPGFLLGGSFYVGDSAQTDGWQPIWTGLLEAHAELRTGGFQARAIVARLTNSRGGLSALASGPDAPGATFQTGALQLGGYLEAGYDVFTFLPNLRMNLIPFARVELLDTQQEVAVGATRDPANRRAVITVGANYKPITQVVVKLDYQVNLNGAGTGRNQLDIGVGYLF